MAKASTEITMTPGERRQARRIAKQSFGPQAMPDYLLSGNELAGIIEDQAFRLRCAARLMGDNDKETAQRCAKDPEFMVRFHEYLRDSEEWFKFCGELFETARERLFVGMTRFIVSPEEIDSKPSNVIPFPRRGQP